ncbi:hypothetical protein [Nocardia cyriacigeorgica]|uniref:hypothetical protein n=1 Tax=Nocardia cyriacigeorgica TaxID=135487 RepID=UPI000CEA288B|nr:hypothetical protein [Nocardia cyriacigeorgica]PPJ01254.1 hypothetical protein C5E43_28915 [Nocardia cyriacigeorgica]
MTSARPITGSANRDGATTTTTAASTPSGRHAGMSWSSRNTASQLTTRLPRIQITQIPTEELRPPPAARAAATTAAPGTAASERLFIDVVMTYLALCVGHDPGAAPPPTKS